MVRLLEVLALMLAAFTLAPVLAHAAELPGKMRLNRESYLAVQRIYYPGFSIIGFAEPVGVLVLLLLVLLTPISSAPFWFYAAAMLALGAMHAVYWTVTHPVNRVWLEGQRLSRVHDRFFGAGAVRGETAGAAPPDWSRLRDRWEYSHVGRAALAVLALIFLALGVTW